MAIVQQRIGRGVGSRWGYGPGAWNGRQVCGGSSTGLVGRIGRPGLALLVCLSLAPVWLAAGEARAGGFSNLDFGIRRMGMLAVTARPDDVTAIFHNPAGLTLMEGTVFYHSQSWFVVDTGSRFYDSQGVLRPDHEVEPDWNVGTIPFLGLVSDLGMDRLRLGFGLYAPNAYGGVLPEDEASRYHLLRALFIASRATLSAAYEVTDAFSIGGGVSLIHVYFTARRIMNPLVLQDPDQRFLPVDQTAALDAELQLDGMAFTGGFNLGFLFRPLEHLRLGIGFESGAPIDLEGEVELKYPNNTSERSTHHTEMVIPFNLRAGFNWEFAPNFQLGADVYYWHYQILQEQRTELERPIMGMTEMVEPKNYSNSWNWCVGLLYQVLPELELMLGYQWDYSPIPTRTLTLENPSQTQFGVSMGARWQVTDTVRLGAAYVHNWFELIDIQDSITNPPTNMKGHGANNEFGFDITWTL
ncbi:MAG: outer membrane protein transport protein [Bradymonadales bacterium]|nr:outer membrane protein transport protein [Bradymonadales bacterium]